MTRWQPTRTRRDALRVIGTAGLVGTAGLGGTAGCLASTRDSTFEEDFEGGIGKWTPSAAIGPEVDITEFEWEVEVSDAQAVSGSQSLRIFNEGDYDDGTTWVVHPISVQSGTTHSATVSAQFWSESESFNTLRDAVMRLGPGRPSVEEDFPHPGLNTTALDEIPYGGLREPLWLTDGWREYRFEWTTPELTTDTIYIAVGTSVIWEGDATHYVDDVTVELSPR